MSNYGAPRLNWYLSCCAVRRIARRSYFPLPLLDVLTPLISALARRFLGQDQQAVSLRGAHAADVPLMMINDADMPQRWYLRLKREWQRQQHEGGPFVNPVQPSTLRWRT
jgi:hypothetical protein